MTTREQAVNLMKSWVGLNEADGSYKQIIDTYNAAAGYHKKTKMQYGWAWCACTWSAVACKLGLYSVMPIEISCIRIIEEAKKMGCWVENDSYTPKIGDGVLYDWDDTGVGDNLGCPDHIGMVTAVTSRSFSVTEGNMSNKVGVRSMQVNGKYIRGFITPNYEKIDKPVSSTETPKVTKTVRQLAEEVIKGVWGSGEDRIKRLKAEGYDPVKVQQEVNALFKKDETKTDLSKAVLLRDGDPQFKGTYKTKKLVYCRLNGSDDDEAVLVPGSLVYSFGEIRNETGPTMSLRCLVFANEKTYTGYIPVEDLTRVG